MTTPHLPPIPDPPAPTEYKLTLSYVTDPFGYLTIDAGSSLTCTLCDAKLVETYHLPEHGISAEDLQKWISAKVTRHQLVNHTEKLWLYTSIGWYRMEWLLDHVTKPAEEAVQ